MHFNKGADPQLTDLPKAPKTARWGKTKNITTTLFTINNTFVHLAKVTSQRVITYIACSMVNVIRYDIASTGRNKILFVTNQMKRALEDCFSCAFEHKS